MIFSFALALFWLAALHRAYLAARSPRLWRVAFAVAVTALAVALTVTLHGASLSGLFPHLDTLIARCFAAAAACAALIYIQTLHHQEPPRRALALNVTGGMVATALVAVTWALSPLQHSGDLFGEGADTHPMVGLHNLVFYLYVAYGAGAAAVYCGRRLFPRRKGDAARAPSLALIGSGAALGTCALILGAAMVLAPPAVSGQLQSTKNALMPVAAGALAAGVLLLLAVSPGVVEAVALHRRWLRLRSLWHGLRAMHPEVALHVRASWPLTQALRIREQRALVEIYDALARERVPSDVRSLEALGRTLRRGERGPVPAASVLPHSGDFATDLQTALRLAAAYDAAPR